VEILGVLEQDGKGREINHERTMGSEATTDFSCRYQVVCMFSSLVLACMAYACGFIGHDLLVTWRIS